MGIILHAGRITMAEEFMRAAVSPFAQTQRELQGPVSAHQTVAVGVMNKIGVALHVHFLQCARAIIADRLHIE